MDSSNFTIYRLPLYLEFSFLDTVLWECDMICWIVGIPSFSELNIASVEVSIVVLFARRYQVKDFVFFTAFSKSILQLSNVNNI